MHLFSADGEALDFARRYYQVRSHRPSALLAKLLGRYVVEGVEMPFDVDKYIQELNEEMRRKALEEATPEQRLEGLTPEQRLEVAKTLPPDQRLEVAKTLSPEQRLEGLTPEQRLAGLSPEQIEEILRRMKADKPADPK